jgi:hypothetical protein
MKRGAVAAAVCCLTAALASDLSAQDPCKSGLQPGLRPGPYSAVVVTGPQRGQSFCYICETADKPAVIIFARSMSDGLGKLALGVDKALDVHKTSDLRGWITFLHDDQASIDDKIVKWAKHHAVSTMPIAVFEDVGGPPSYKLAKDADVTVMLFTKQKVVYNFAFRSGELTDARVAEVLKAIPELVKK